MKGITVTLYEKTLTGYDDANCPVYTETPVEVDNVLVAPVSGDEIVETLELYGRKAVYQLGIPKGDTHSWENSKVGFFGRDWHTVGPVLQGIDDLIPLSWNRKIRVENYE